jgi:hypothetical protein
MVVLLGLGKQVTPPSTHFKKGKGLPESRDANIMLTKTTSLPNQRVFAEWQRRYADLCAYLQFTNTKAARATVARHTPILYLDPVADEEHMQKEEESTCC